MFEQKKSLISTQLGAIGTANTQYQRDGKTGKRLQGNRIGFIPLRKLNVVQFLPKFGNQEQAITYFEDEMLDDLASHRHDLDVLRTLATNRGWEDLLERISYYCPDDNEEQLPNERTITIQQIRELDLDDPANLNKLTSLLDKAQEHDWNDLEDVLLPAVRKLEDARDAFISGNLRSATKVDGKPLDLAGIRQFLQHYHLPLPQAYDDIVNLYFVNKGRHRYTDTEAGARALWIAIKNTELFDHSGQINNQWKYYQAVKHYSDNAKKLKEEQEKQEAQESKATNMSMASSDSDDAQSAEELSWQNHHDELMSGYCANLAALYRIAPEKVRKVTGNQDIGVPPGEFQGILKTLFDDVGKVEKEPQNWHSVLQKTIVFDDKHKVVEALASVFRRLKQAQINSYYIELSTTAHGMGIHQEENGSTTILEPNHHTNALHNFTAESPQEKAQTITDYIWETGLSYSRENVVNLSAISSQKVKQLPSETNIKVLNAEDLAQCILSLQQLNVGKTYNINVYYDGKSPDETISQNTSTDTVRAIARQLYQDAGHSEFEMLDIDVRTKQSNANTVPGTDAQDDSAELKNWLASVQSDQQKGKVAKIIKCAKNYNPGINLQ